MNKAHITYLLIFISSFIGVTTSTSQETKVYPAQLKGTNVAGQILRTDENGNVGWSLEKYGLLNYSSGDNVSSFVGDLNTFKTGFAYCNNNTTNTPTAEYGYVIDFHANDNFGVQSYVTNSGVEYIRRMYSGNWGAWRLKDTTYDDQSIQDSIAQHRIDIENLTLTESDPTISSDGIDYSVLTKYGNARIWNNRLIVKAGGKIRVNNNYDLPNVDGGDGQVLRTDGNGNVGWSDELFSSHIAKNITNEDTTRWGIDKYGLLNYSSGESVSSFVGDLNTFKTGFAYCNNNTTNTPTAEYGYVIDFHANDNFGVQSYVTNSGVEYIRRMYSGNWGAWRLKDTTYDDQSIQDSITQHRIDIDNALPIESAASKYISEYGMIGSGQTVGKGFYFTSSHGNIPRGDIYDIMNDIEIKPNNIGGFLTGTRYAYGSKSFKNQADEPMGHWGIYRSYKLSNGGGTLNARAMVWTPSINIPASTTFTNYANQSFVAEEDLFIYFVFYDQNGTIINVDSQTRNSKTAIHQYATFSQSSGNTYTAANTSPAADDWYECMHEVTTPANASYVTIYFYATDGDNTVKTLGHKGANAGVLITDIAVNYNAGYHEIAEIPTAMTMYTGNGISGNNTASSPLKVNFTQGVVDGTGLTWSGISGMKVRGDISYNPTVSSISGGVKVSFPDASSFNIIGTQTTNVTGGGSNVFLESKNTYLTSFITGSSGLEANDYYTLIIDNNSLSEHGFFVNDSLFTVEQTGLYEITYRISQNASSSPDTDQIVLHNQNGSGSSGIYTSQITAPSSYLNHACDTNVVTLTNGTFYKLQRRTRDNGSASALRIIIKKLE